MPPPSSVNCCFCGVPLAERDAVLIVIYPTAARDDSQKLYAHRGCLVERVRRELVLHPALDDEDRISDFSG
jgi:hypothetical protein